MDDEAVEAELIELLSCHRTDSRQCFSYMEEWYNERQNRFACVGGIAKKYIPMHACVYMCLIEESDGPFPWSLVNRNVKEDNQTKGKSMLPGWVSSAPVSLQSNPSFRAIALQAASMGSIAFKLPRCQNITAGQVLLHCINAIQNLFEKHEPLIFKVGYTHDPCWRWGNSLYGYCRAKEKWSQMIVLWISDEPFGPAMLEASLIEMFKGI